MISENTVRLNVRQSPDISAKVIGRVLLTYKDMVVAEYNNKWGLLKDFGGWVDLRYVKKI